MRSKKIFIFKYVVCDCILRTLTKNNQYNPSIVVSRGSSPFLESKIGYVKGWDLKKSSTRNILNWCTHFYKVLKLSDKKIATCFYVYHTLWGTHTNIFTKNIFWKSTTHFGRGRFVQTTPKYMATQF